MPQPELLKKVLTLLDENHIDYMVTGLLVSIMQRQPRATHDIDILVNISHSAIPPLVDTFTPPDYYLSASAIKDAIRHNSKYYGLKTHRLNTLTESHLSVG